VSLLSSRRFTLIAGPLVSVIGLGVALMLSKFLWLGLIIAAVGLLFPLPAFWSDVRKVRIVLLSGTPPSLRVKRLPLDLWCYLGAFLIGASIIIYIFLGLLQPEQSHVTKTDIARALRTSFVRKAITHLNGNMILLDHEPQPESVLLVVNGKEYFAQNEPGLHLQGRKLTLENVEGNEPLLKIVQEDAPRGGVILEYQRHLTEEEEREIQK